MCVNPFEGQVLGEVQANMAILDRFYTLSIILGTVALSYGSVPMYKMVRRLSILGASRSAGV